MTTRQFLLTYDDEEHSDIHHFLNSLPDRQKSKHVRIALQKYLRNDSTQKTYTTVIESDQRRKTKHETEKEVDDQLLEIPDSILDIGK